MAELRATPYANPLTGLSNDVIQGLLGYMKDRNRTQQMQGLAGLLESTGIPKTIERAAYAESPAGLLNALTNVNRANVPLLKPETADALLTLSPVPSGANKAAMAAGKAGEQYAEKVVPQILERGGLPAGLLQDLAQGTRSQIFIGPSSKAFDKHAAITAFQLEKKGVSPQEIWQQTGTVRGPDGQWRQEISDMASSIKGNKPFEDVIMGAYQKGAANTGNQLYKTTVEDVLMHNRLKDAYPEIMGIETQMMRKGANQNVRGSLGTDSLNKEQILQVRKDLSPEEARSTILHELQHAVQESEAFGAGGNTETMDRLIGKAKERKFLIENTDEFKEGNKLNNELWDKYFTENANIDTLKAKEEALLKKYPILQEHREASQTVRMLGDDPYDAYRRLIGEAEARLVQTRANLSNAEKKQFFPFEFQDEKRNPYGLDVSPESLIYLDTYGNLIQKGFDGLKLKDSETGKITYQIFNPEKLSVNKSYISPQQEALDTAQRNAALPVEEGGLGLPKDNTPKMRAEAMGYNTPAYHGTTVWEAEDGRKLGDIEAFNRLASTEIVGRKPSIDQMGIWASDRPDASGAGMYSGSQGAIYPLMLRMENPKATSFEQMARTASNLSGGKALGATEVPRVSDVEPYRQRLKEQGYDSLMLRAKEGSPYTEFVDQTGYVLLEPSQVRSRFAAFDPMRRNEADILAGVLPLGLLADEEQRKKLYELMPSLLGQ